MPAAPPPCCRTSNMIILLNPKQSKTVRRMNLPAAAEGATSSSAAVAKPHSRSATPWGGFPSPPTLPCHTRRPVVIRDSVICRRLFLVLWLGLALLLVLQVAQPIKVLQERGSRWAIADGAAAAGGSAGREVQGKGCSRRGAVVVYHWRCLQPRPSSSTAAAGGFAGQGAAECVCRQASQHGQIPRVMAATAASDEQCRHAGRVVQQCRPSPAAALRLTCAVAGPAGNHPLHSTTSCTPQTSQQHHSTHRSPCGMPSSATAHLRHHVLHAAGIEVLAHVEGKLAPAHALADSTGSGDKPAAKQAAPEAGNTP